MKMAPEERFYAAIIIYFLLLIVLSATTPISPSEAKTIYSGDYSLSGYLAGLSHPWIPGMLGYRFFPLLAGFVSMVLYRKLSEEYFGNRDDSRLCIIVYMLLPGVIASAVLVNDAVYALMGTLIFLYAYKKDLFLVQISALTLVLLTDTGSFALFFAVALYSFRKRQFKLFWISIILFILSIYIGLFDFEGKPKGHLVELFGVYAALFSPLLFVYFFYSMYRVMLNGPHDIYWYISFVAFVISLLLSIRQKILIVDFGPYLLIGTMISISVFSGSLRVRMRTFQRPYLIAKNIILLFLVFSAAVMILHRPIYRALGNPHGFFASALYEPYDLAASLKKEGRRCYMFAEIGNRSKYIYVMKHYGLEKCSSLKRVQH